MQIAPEVLLAPGALETIVINNGAFYVTGASGSNPPTPNGEAPQLILHDHSTTRHADTPPYVRKTEGHRFN